MPAIIKDKHILNQVVVHSIFLLILLGLYSPVSMECEEEETAPNPDPFPPLPDAPCPCPRPPVLPGDGALVTREEYDPEIVKEYNEIKCQLVGKLEELQLEREHLSSSSKMLLSLMHLLLNSKSL